MDIYKHPVLSDLVAYIESKNQKEEQFHKREVHRPSNFSYRLCTLGQGLMMIPIALLYGLEWLGPFFVYSYYYQADNEVLYSLGMMLGTYFALLPVLSVLAILMKWLIIGKVKAGRYKLWGWYYFRFWLADKIIAICPVAYFAGMPIINVFLRLLGANIGKNCYINTHFFSAYDLLAFGKDVSISTDSRLRGYAISDGYLTIGSITLEDDFSLEHVARFRPTPA